MLYSTSQNCYIKHLLFHIGTDCPTILAAIRFLKTRNKKMSLFEQRHLIKAFHALLDLEVLHNITVRHIHVKLQKRKR